MPRKRPIFLFAFANDEQYRLRLEEEERRIRNQLREADRRKEIEYKPIGQTNLDDIYASFNSFNDQIYIFHYGGHSDHQFLHLKDNHARSESLATFIGQQKYLKLVFLNGCSNKAQVETLFEKGVPAVIATSANVNDQHSLELAEQFYQALAVGKTIEQAFDTAKSYIQNSRPTIDIQFRAGRKFPKEKNGFPWGLYVQDESVLEWTIHSIEKGSRLELMQKLRQASKERHRIFTDSKNGRFRHLNIRDTILAGIKGVKKEENTLIDDNIKLNDKQQSLHESLPLLWKKGCPHAMIVGPGGMGKTVSLLRLWERWVDKEDPMAPVPIFIQLNEFNSWQKEGFIENFIREYYVNLEIEELIKFSNTDAKEENIPHIFLLLDGLNEVTASSNDLLLEINRLRVQDKYPGVQLLITSRVDLRQTYQWYPFHLLALKPLTDEQIRQYLNKRVPKEPRLRDLLGNPMMLSIYAAQMELPKHYFEKGILKKEVSSTGEMLYNVEAIQRIKIEEQYSTNPSNQAFHRFVLEHLLPFIGWEMQQSGIFFIQKNSLNENQIGLKKLMIRGVETLLSDVFFDTFEFFDLHLSEEYFQENPRQLYNLIIRNIAVKDLAILANDGENYRFLHQNFRDYFAARHVQNQIKISLYNKELPFVLQNAPLDFYVRQILGELEGEHTNRIEWDEINKKWKWRKGDFFLENHLKKLLEFCRGVFDQSLIGYVVWNILTILKEHRGELSGANLCHLNFQSFSLNELRISRPGLTACLAGGKIRDENLFPQGHSNGILSIAYSPNGRYIITGSKDKTAKVWDSLSHQCTLTLQGHFGPVFTANFSPDSNYIVTGSNDHSIKLWDFKTGKCIFTVRGNWNQVWSASFSPNGKYIIASLGDHTVKIWDIQTEQLFMTLEGHSHSVRSAEYSSDGGKIVTCSGDNQIKLWDSKTGKCLRTLKGHSNLVTSVAVSPDGRYIASGSWDHTIKLWDLNSGQCQLTMKGHSNDVLCVGFSPDGKKIASSSGDNTIKIWDTHSGQCLNTLNGHLNWVNSIAYNPNGKNIVSGSHDFKVKIWDSYSGKCISTFEGFLNLVTSAVYSYDSESIIIGSADKTAKVCDSKTGVCVLILEKHWASVRSISFSPIENHILTGSRDKTAKVWDSKTGKCLISLEGHFSDVLCTAYSPDGTQIATGSADKTIKLWDAFSGKCLKTLQGHYYEVTSINFNINGDQLISGSFDKTAKVWDFNTGECEFSLIGHSNAITCIACSPDGKYFATGSSDNTVKIWDAHSGKCLSTVNDHSDDVLSVAYSLEGKYFVTGSADSTIKIWDAHLIKCLETLKGHWYEVQSTCFSSNGKYLLSGSYDCTTKIWDVHKGYCLLTLPNISGLFIQGCSFRDLNPDSHLSEESIEIMRQYGGIFNDEDERKWKASMEKYFGKET